MQNYSSLIIKIKKEFSEIQNENFTPASDGTHYKVFLSKKYVIRFWADKPKILSREANFLKLLNHQLIPKVLWTGYNGLANLDRYIRIRRGAISPLL